MRLAYLIAGAGGMYCGSCLRDNRLAATLIAQGRDVVLIPLYTPIRTDEVDVSEPTVYYGGINVYLRQRSRLYRRLPGWVTRRLDSPRLLRRAMRLAGSTSPATLGDLTVSMLRGEEGAQHKELSRLIEGLRAIQPDVIHLPNLMFVGMARRLKAALNVPVLCTLSGEDIFIDKLPPDHRSEAMELIRLRSADIDGFVAVTEYFATFARDRFGLPPDRVHVVPMGIDVTGVGEPAAPADGPFIIGYLARICDDKGLLNLCDAFVQLRRAGRDCRLRVAGYLGAGDRDYFLAVRKYVRHEGVDDVFEYVGEVDRAGKFELLRSLHVLSVPTLYPESKGLYVLEAMATGTPVVQPRHGSFPELVEATGGGLLYDPLDPQGLPGALARLMDDRDLLARLGATGRAAVHESFTDRIMAERTWTLCLDHRQREKTITPGDSAVPATLQADSVTKSFPTRSGELVILTDVSLALSAGESAAIMGSSGSGKSTVLNILGTLESPSGGTVRIDGKDPFALSDGDLARFRNRLIGFIFQEHHLLPQCSVLENVLVPTLADGKNTDQLARAKELLERVGLSHRLDHRPAELSGGERQRVAIARALINRPAVVLADEPTGNLDAKTAGSVVDLLMEVYREANVVLLVVTHSETLATRFDARFDLVDGSLIKR